MPINTYSKGKEFYGDAQYVGGGKVEQVKSNTVAYTEAGTAKALFTVPANAIIDRLLVVQKTADNAGTTATISVGKTLGSPVEYLNAADAKSAQTAAYTTLPAAYGSVGTSQITVYGLLTETGTASSAGSIFVSCSYHMP